MKVAVSGVKGGVGKSTFSVLLALKLAKEKKKVMLCDLDVECPNDYLLLNQKLENPEEIYTYLPKLKEEKCKKCGLCSKVCKENAIFWVPDKYPIFIYDLCNGCGACWITCPNKAIDKEKVKIGEMFMNKVNENLILITGKSVPLFSETGIVVREIMERVLEMKEKLGVEEIIVDTAPGAHCNLIQVLVRVDKVYAVTEPTPLGAYDLRVMLEVAKKLGIEVEVVLNKANVGDRKEIEKIVKEFGKEIILEIPFSSRVIDAYCSSRLEEVLDLIWK
ncbi:MAG TPA: P-loop ATPase [Candidatus Aenigmarchaeota archaeon]|nr:P-loop ATPase [Candidatus Aenigmarchaeota archaeon]